MFELNIAFILSKDKIICYTKDEWKMKDLNINSHEIIEAVVCFITHVADLSFSSVKQKVVIVNKARKYSQQHATGVGWPCCFQIHSRPYPLCTYLSVSKWDPFIGSEERQSFETLLLNLTMTNTLSAYRFLAERIKEKPFVN